MRAFGEAAVPQSVRDELKRARRIVQEREHVLHSSAGARGSKIGMSSEQAKLVAAETYASSEKAIGSKSVNGAHDPRRLAQFDRLLAEQQDIFDRNLPNAHHACRTDG